MPILEGTTLRARARAPDQPLAVSHTAALPPLDLDQPDVVSCKCCGGRAAACGLADFNRSCEDRRTLPPFAPAGIGVPYHRCAGCGFLFTAAFDRLAPDDFARHVYNDDYVRVDPDFTGTRPRANAQWLASLFPAARGRALLDYGGGNGMLAALLRDGGWPRSVSYDPFHPDGGGRPAGRFDIVTAFEVLEHATSPEAVLRDMRWFLEDGGILVFSTLLQPADIERQGLGWWYVAPRNGHVSLFSRAALDALMRRLGLQWGSFSDATHIAYRRRLPRFAAHLAGGA